MARIAIIGTGIAGMGCGHFLHRKHDCTFYERNDYPGGHTNTITVDEDGTPVSMDTGFMVYNEVTYPNLTRLFREIGAPTMNTSMSFSVNHVPSGLEWCGSGFGGLFGQRRNLFRPSFYRFLSQVNRFNTTSAHTLDNPAYDEMSLGEYVQEQKFGDDFLQKYLIPMSSAVWSTPPDMMLRFPVQALVRFFSNHGFLGLNTQHQWKTVEGGSRRYRDLLIAPFRDKIQCRREAVGVTRDGTSALVRANDGSEERFDMVIFACHADEALRIITNPLPAETALLKEFGYQENVATIHTDVSIMPRTRRVWSSWNYRIDTDAQGGMLPSTIYYMNSLQKVSSRRDYFVSINDPGRVRPSTILRTIKYTHPLFTVGTRKAQKELPSLNRNGMLWFCGSYFRYGFHEDAFTSALSMCRMMTGEPLWK